MRGRVQCSPSGAVSGRGVCPGTQAYPVNKVCVPAGTRAGAGQSWVGVRARKRTRLTKFALIRDSCRGWAVLGWCPGTQAYPVNKVCAPAGARAWAGQNRDWCVICEIGARAWVGQNRDWCVICEIGARAWAGQNRGWCVVCEIGVGSGAGQSRVGAWCAGYRGSWWRRTWLSGCGAVCVGWSS